MGLSKIAIFQPLQESKWRALKILRVRTSDPCEYHVFLKDAT